LKFEPDVPLLAGGKIAVFVQALLGPHNGIYDEQRALLRSIPGLNQVEMEKPRDRGV
jgi:Fe-S oxidoreductase